MKSPCSSLSPPLHSSPYGVATAATTGAAAAGAAASAALLQTVVYQLLTTLVECMKPELVVHLIGRLQECADGVAGNSRGACRNEVLAFVECLANNHGHVILTRSVGQPATFGQPVS